MRAKVNGLLVRPNLFSKLVTGVLAVGVLLIVSLGTVSTSARADGPSISLTPAVGLRDGQSVTVSWSGYEPNGFVYVRQCVRGATTSSQCAGGSGQIVEQSNAQGSGFTYYRVVSTQNTNNSSLPGADGTHCGADFPCEIVVSTSSTISQPDQGQIENITFAPEAESCPTENMKNLTGGGSGALKVIMPSWQVGLCNGSDRVTLDYIASRGDVGGMQDFYCGLSDFAITEIASDSGNKCALSGQNRDAIYVPIANNALVFAYSMRNRLDHQYLKKMILTPDMLAQTMTGQSLYWGAHDVSDDADRAIYALNNADTPHVMNATGNGSEITFTAISDLKVGDTVSIEDVKPAGYNDQYQVTGTSWVDDNDHSKGQKFTVDGSYRRNYVNGGLVNPQNLIPGSILVYGRADASGLNYLMTKFFLSRAGTAFHAAGGQFDEQGLPSASVYMPMSTKFDPSVFKSNQQAVVAAMLGSDDQSGGNGWLAPMDAGTAKYYGFPAISIANTSGTKFITPTNNSVAAGLAETTIDSKTGVASSNVSPTNQDAYPLVFTIYAVVPTHTDSKKSAVALKAMLTYIRDHSAQSDVPEGYAPLTPEQKQQITDALPKIVEPSPVPSASATPTPTPTSLPSSSASEIPIPVDTSVPAIPSIIGGTDSNGNTDGVDSGSINHGTEAANVPSVFAVPFVPKNGLASGILPAMFLVGMSASVSGILRRRNGIKNG